MKQVRPPDPMPLRDHAREARAELKKFDDKLDFWWNARADCWSIREWLRRSGRWSHTFDWKGPAGEYRSILPIGPVLTELRRMDWELLANRYGMGEGFQDAVEEDMGRGRRQTLERRKAEVETIRKSYAKDVMGRAKDFHLETGGKKRRAYEQARQEHTERLRAAHAGE